MKEIEISQLALYKQLFNGPELDLLISSVLDGNSRARCWASTGGSSALWALLWDRCNNVLYLGGQVSPGNQPDLRALVTETIHAQSIQGGRHYFKGRGLTDENTKVLVEVLAECKPSKDKRMFYTYGAPAFDLGKIAGIVGVEVVPITRALIEDRRPGNLDEVVEEIESMWPSLEAFYQNGFGQAALADGAVVSWCTSEYVSRNRCGIGIATVPQMRQKGIARLTAAHFVSQSLGRSIVPHWDCAGQNIPSVKLAQKLGFELISEEDFLYWKV